MQPGSFVPASPGPLNIGILLFRDVEVLDFAGPYEVFSVAARLAPAALELNNAPFRVMTVAETRQPLAARHGLQVIPDHDFADVPALDVVVVPGGIVAEPLANPATLLWLRGAVKNAKVTASVCTGAFILAKIGLLDGRTATTHWEDVEEMRKAFPGVKVVDNISYVDQGEVLTSAGISAGIAMSLHLVGRLLGVELALLTARQMQYDWQPQPQPLSSES